MPDTSPSPWGTLRRLRALLARGWGTESIEEASGIPAADTMRAVSSSNWYVRSGLAERVASAYEDLWNREPPDEDRERITPRAAGWPPPMAWDDDVIDLPEGKPAEGWKRTRSADHQPVRRPGRGHGFRLPAGRISGRKPGRRRDAPGRDQALPGQGARADRADGETRARGSRARSRVTGRNG